MKLAYLLAASAGALACGTGFAQQAPAPVEVVDGPVTAVEARSTALTLAGILEADYVFPDVARKYAATLRANAASGAYDSLGMSMALAERLTADLRAVSPDNHLRVMVGPPGRPGIGPANPGPPSG